MFDLYSMMAHATEPRGLLFGSAIRRTPGMPLVKRPSLPRSAKDTCVLWRGKGRRSCLRADCPSSTIVLYKFSYQFTERRVKPEPKNYKEV